MIVCIPTKSRPDTKTYQLFNSVGIEVYHFIEPQEYDIYNVPNKVNIELNDKGISYCRNFILDWARYNNHKWVIVCDDDINHFGVVKNKRCKKTDAGIWKNILEKAKTLPFELYGIQFRQYAWSSTKNYEINGSFIQACILFNIEKINWRYTHNTKEDRDFQLKTIKYGTGVVRLNKYFFACPDLGTNKGGLHDLYKQKKDIEWSKKLLKDWGKYVKIIKRKGRIDAKVDLKQFTIENNKILI
jgi:hypothetical protein